VFVGRGVRAERAPLIADTTASTPVTTPDVPRSEPLPTASGSDPTAAAPPPQVDELSYFSRLEKPGQPADDLKPAQKAPPGVEKPRPPDKPAAVDKSGPVEKSAPAEKPPSARATPPPASNAQADPIPVSPPTAAAASAEPSGQGFALQVTALRERGEAEAIAKRLSSKGYTAYVVTPANGTSSVYRVRIGKFKTRREAEAIATRLQKEEQFTPWITR
jgi:cell division septation protein DedD